VHTPAHFSADGARVREPPDRLREPRQSGPEADRDGVVAGRLAGGDPVTAEAVRAAARPAAPER
jgi:hypothetical protein